MGGVHREALLQVGQRTLFLVLPVQGGTDAVVPHGVSHAFGFDTAQQLDRVRDEFLERIHVGLRVV